MAYPTNPTTGDTYTLGTKSWTYDGTHWINQATFATYEPTVIPAAIPVGAVIYHAANTAPTDFIKANGAAVSRTTYSDLFAAIGTTFGVGDGSSTFNVPDLRGEFMRGWDDSRGVDSGRGFGSAQDEEFKLHGHASRRAISQVVNDHDGGGIMIDENGSQSNVAAYTGNPQNVTGRHIGGSGGDETRPRNIALLACIKY